MTSPATCVFCDKALHASLGDKRLLFAIATKIRPDILIRSSAGSVA